MKKSAILLVAFTFLLIGCESKEGLASPTVTKISLSATATIRPSDTPKPTETNTPTSTQTNTPTSTQTNTPTITPTFIGGATNPILAISMQAIDESQSFIYISELFSKRELARIPISDSGETLRLSPNGEMLAFIDTREDQQGIYLYNLLTEDIILLYAQPDETGISNIRWSPDQKWLAFEMDIFSRRNTEIWIVDVENKSPKYISVGFTNNWLPSGELYYQNSGGENFQLNVVTDKSSIIQHQRFTFQNMENFLSANLSNLSFSYLPELETFIMNGRNLNDPENPQHFIINREIDESPGLYLAYYTTETDLLLWNLLLSPDGKLWMICFNEGEGIRGMSSDGFGDGEFFTSWASHDELPLTSENFTVENFLPYIWAPDGNSILGFRYESRSIKAIEILDLQSGKVLFNYPISRVENLLPRTYFSSQKPRTFDVKWSTDQVDLSSVEYVTKTPTTTATMPPNVSQNQPMVDYIEGLEKALDVNLSNLNSQSWEYSDIEIQEDQSVMVTGTGKWDGYFDYKAHRNSNQGVLVKFKYQKESSGILALTRGDWDTPGYRQWGTIINRNGSRPLISSGSDHSTRAEVISELELKSDQWYYFFLGIYDNELVQILWDPNYPVDYGLAYHDFGDSDDLPYFFHLAVNTGQFYISEMTMYEFDGFIDRD